MHFNSQVTLVTSSQPNWAFATAPATWLCELPDSSVWNLGYAVVQDTHYDFSTDKQLVHLLAWCHEWNEDTPETWNASQNRSTKMHKHHYLQCFRVAWVSCSHTNEASLHFTCRTWGGHAHVRSHSFCASQVFPCRILGDLEIKPSLLWICAALQSLFEVEEHSWAINPNGTRAREYASTQKPGGREFCSHAELLNEIVFSVSSLSFRCLKL